MTDTTQPSAADAEQPQPKTPKKRGSWLKRLLAVAVVLVLLLVVLVALLPTLVSTGPGTKLVAEQVSAAIPGRVEIGDLDVGWFSPTRIADTRLFDADNALVAELFDAQTELTILGALGGGTLDLGRVVVDANLARVEFDTATGRDNLSDALGIEPSDEPTDLSTIKADVVAKLRGTFTVKTPDGDAVVDLLESEQRIGINGEHTLRYELDLPLAANGERGSVAVTGTSDLPGGIVAYSPEAEVGLLVSFGNMSTDLLGPLLRVAGLTQDVDATLGGTLRVDQTGGALSADSDLTLAGVEARGLVEGGPAVTFGSIELPATIRQEGGVIVVSDLRVVADGEEAVTLTGRLPEDIAGRLGGDALDASLLEGVTLDASAAVSPELMQVAAGFLPAGQRDAVLGLAVRADAGVADGVARVQADVSDGGRSLVTANVTANDFELSPDGTRVELAEQAVRVSDVKALLTRAGVELPVEIEADALAVDGGGTLVLDDAGGRFTPREALRVGTDATTVRMPGGPAALMRQPIGVAVGEVAWRSVGDTTAVTAAVPEVTVGEGNGLIEVASLSLPQVESGPDGVVAAFDVTRLSVRDLSALQPMIPAGEDGEPVVELRGGGLNVAGAGRFDSSTTTLTTTRPLEASLPNLSVAQAGETLLDRQDVNLLFDGQADGDALNLNTLSLRVDGGQTLALTASGRVADLTSTRRFEDVTGTLAYDLGRLQPLLRTLAGDPQLVASGRVEEPFTLAGSYPVFGPDKASEAIKRVTLNAALGVPSLRTSGVEVADLRLPVRVEGGALFLEQQSPATVNGGSLDLSPLFVDLTTTPLTLRTNADGYVLRDVKLNDVFADLVGDKSNPLLANAAGASGLLDVAVSKRSVIPLDATALQRARADGQFSVRELNLETDAFSLAMNALTSAVVPAELRAGGQGGGGNGGGGLGDLLRGVGELDRLRRQIEGEDAGERDRNNPVQELLNFGKLGDLDRLRGFIEAGEVAVESGVLRQDVTINVFDPRDVADAMQGQAETFPLRIHGTVNLNTSEQDLTLTFPKSLMDRWLPQEVADLVPAEGLPVRYRGTPDNPTATLSGAAEGLFDGIGRRLIEGELQKQLDRGRDRDEPAPDGEQPEQPKSIEEQLEDEAQKAIERGLRGLFGGDDE